MSNVLVAAINSLVLVFAAVVGLTLTRSSAKGRAGPVIAIAGATLIGLANGYLPALAALRDQMAIAQPLMVAGMTIGLLAVALSAGGRAVLRTAALRPLIALHSWRVVFGLLLLATGLAGGLPPAFFWSVAIGDIMVGLWAISIWRRRSTGIAELQLWSALGLIDLLHVLPRAAITLPVFYAAQPELFRPILLPLLGVPILIALQVVLLWRFLAIGKSPEAIDPVHHH